MKRFLNVIEYTVGTKNEVDDKKEEEEIKEEEEKKENEEEKEIKSSMQKYVQDRKSVV